MRFAVHDFAGLGTLTLLNDERSRLVYCQFGDVAELLERFDAQPGVPVEFPAIKQLEEYLAGQRRNFDIPLALTYTTDFQRRVLTTLLAVPYGQTISYSELASEVGDPRAARAVGTALHNNPICIIVPCHRVIKADGSLGGYAGREGLKRHLLDLERAHLDADN
uniref:methylated-DNA--[protein]-cysteine S-methyltransferase n=1 Tax=Vaginimicrobium propionicum TaxID=1871034 RepID=UPI0009FB5484|nr:methylated-DNA--[protein]-cysteine S-methyltransferase [Vaginimicrobium propionicum]